MVYNINVEFQIKQSNERHKQSNKMVKTRNQNQQIQQTQQKKSEGVTTRSGFMLKTLERVELPAVKLSKEMKCRVIVKKAIAKKSWKKQTDKKCKRFERLERDFLKHVYHNAGEMTAIWKNFEMAFNHIDKLCSFQKCLEGK